MSSFLHDIIMRGLERGLGEGLCVFGTPRISARTETREPRESRRGGPSPRVPMRAESYPRLIVSLYTRWLLPAAAYYLLLPLPLLQTHYDCHGILRLLAPSPLSLSLSPSYTYTFCRLLSFLHFLTRLRPVPR